VHTDDAQRFLEKARRALEAADDATRKPRPGSRGRRHEKSEAVTDFVEFPGRSHLLLAGGAGKRSPRPSTSG
jgi:DNA-binding transcriptional LysR family regulator